MVGVARLGRSFGIGLGFALLALAAGVSSGAAQSDKGAAKAPGAAPGVEAKASRAGPSGLLLPRFVSLRAPKANLRTGPGVRYPIDWVYTRPGLPLEVIGEFETWRRVRDWDGSIGWVHQSMLSGERRALVLVRQRTMRREPIQGAAGVALVEAGVTGRVLRCTGAWCRVEVKGFEGWLRRDGIYGVYPDETVE